MTTIKSSLSDTPFDEDRNDFGTERYVNGLIKFIENSSAPITIALQGEWGSGKTSLMTRLEKALCSPDGQFVGIDINTWEYSMLSSPEETVYKIIEQLVNSMSKESPAPKHKLDSLLKKSRGPLYRGVREAIKMIPGAGVIIEAANIPADIKNDEDEHEAATLSDLKESLEEGVRKIKGDSKRGVIVFVDDLDRLNPPVAVEILELLKNIFCIKDCIFVLAIDYEVVVKGLEPKFGKLTDKNEREFRSFFDKIIQVPFSLPVNSYRPMNFVLDSLGNIGYISAGEKMDSRITKPFQKIVEYSVGKNPRSIKRLINALSLLSCIAQCGEDDDAEFSASREGRIVNFAIVALQVCYPKIYRMLSLNPNFTEWDDTIACRLNIPFKRDSGSAPDWEEILEAACSTDRYLEQHFNDIRSLLLMIQSTIESGTDKKSASFEERIRSIIDKSSVTVVSEPSHNIEVDQKRMIGRLHDNVFRRLQTKFDVVPNITIKKNTGNGGFFIDMPDGSGRVEIIIRPQVLTDRIACELLLSTRVNRPAYPMEKSFDEMIADTNVREMFETFDSIISPLLKDAEYFEGHTYPESGKGTYFGSFAEEQAYLSGKGWLDPFVCEKVSYWINLSNESLFEDKAIVDTIADVVKATYELRLAADKL